MSVGNLFNEAWYLENNPDVREAVEQGIISAWDHFNLYGRFESRAPSPLFDPEYYLAQNPDVAAAVRAGVGTAYDHFMQYGINEARSFVSFFDVNFYLSTNSDVSNAAGGDPSIGIMHFLMHGQGEPRAISPFFDLRAYLDANPDVADAVEQLGASPLEHLLTHGLNEPRDLGNGINLAQFANDPVFNNAGSPMEALARIAEVAPFLPSFEPPAGWEPPANTPIPTNFVPVDGEKLVIPPSVDVPDDVEIPEDVFEPVEPGPQPEPEEPPVDPGTPEGREIEITLDKAEFFGTARADTFYANSPGSIRNDLQVDGRGGTDSLYIADGAIVAVDEITGPSTYAKPTIENVERIYNSHVGAAVAWNGGEIGKNAVYLDLTDVEGVKQIWTDFTGQKWGDDGTKGAYGTNTIGVFYQTDLSHDKDNIFTSTVFGIEGVAGRNDLGQGGGRISFVDKGFDNAQIKHLNVALRGNEKKSLYGAAQAQEVEEYTITVHKGNEGNIHVSDQVQKITILGEGNLAFEGRKYDKLETFDASKAGGNIDFRYAGSKKSDLEKVTFLGGKGNDQFDLSLATSHLMIDAGGGEDIIKFNTDYNVQITGGSGKNTFKVVSDATPDNATTTYSFIRDYKEGDIIDLTGVKHASLKSQTAIYSSNSWAQDEPAEIAEGGTIIKLLNSSKGSSPILILDGTYAAETTIEIKMTAEQMPDELDDIPTAEGVVTILASIADKAEIDASDSSYDHGVFLLGGNGSQKLIGSAGSDFLYGGKGNDTFVLDATYGMAERGDEVDTIMDFSAGDRIEVEALVGAGLSSSGVGESGGIKELGDWYFDEDNATLHIAVAGDEESGLDIVTLVVLGDYNTLSVDSNMFVGG